MLKLLLTLLVCYLLLCLLLYFRQRDLLYFPTSENQQISEPVIWLEQHNQRIKIWKINEGEKALIYFGGNAEAVENNIPEFKTLFAEYSIYLVNYRGYGGSSGKPSEAALFSDALAIYDHLQAGYSSINVMGRSLGSGVAVFLASQRPVEQLILVTAYDSIQNVAKSHYPFFPIGWLLKDCYDSLFYSRRLQSNNLLLIANNDRVIPRKHSDNLISHLDPDRTSISVIPDSNHADITQHVLYRKSIADFINDS